MASRCSLIIRISIKYGGIFNKSAPITRLWMTISKLCRLLHVFKKPGTQNKFILINWIHLLFSWQRASARVQKWRHQGQERQNWNGLLILFYFIFWVKIYWMRPGWRNGFLYPSGVWGGFQHVQKKKRSSPFPIYWNFLFSSSFYFNLYILKYIIQDSYLLL